MEGLSRVAHLDLEHPDLLKSCVQKILSYFDDFPFTFKEALSALRSCSALSIHDPDLFNGIIQSLAEQEEMQTCDWLKVLDHLCLCGFRCENLLTVFVEKCLDSHYQFSAEDSKVLLRILADVNVQLLDGKLQEKLSEILHGLNLSDVGKR